MIAIARGRGGGSHYLEVREDGHGIFRQAEVNHDFRNPPGYGFSPVSVGSSPRQGVTYL